MYTLKPFYQFCDRCKILPWAIYFKETNIKFFKCLHGFRGYYLKMRDACMDFEPCSKRYIALSQFILKSSDLDKINAASYPNLSCSHVRILIAYNDFKTRPCPLRNFRVAKTTSFPFLILPCTLSFTHMQSLNTYFFDK